MRNQLAIVAHSPDESFNHRVIHSCNFDPFAARMLPSGLLEHSEWNRPQLPTNSVLRKTPLNAVHRRLGAKMVNFGGWDMPVEYPSSGGLIAEHHAVRGACGLFDVSHMGDIRVHTGKAPAARWRRCSTSP